MTDAYILGALIGFIGIPVGLMVYLYIIRDPHD